MADVWIDESGWKDGDLPDICLECGAPAPDRVRRRFVYQPPWVYVTIPLGAIVLVLVMYVTRKQFRSRVPMCSEHKNHWRRRALWIFVSLVVAVQLAILASVAAINLPDVTVPRLVLGAALFCSLGWIITVAFIHAGTIRLTTFSKRSIRLTRVSPEFVDAYEAGPDHEGKWRGRVKADLDPVALRRWGESRENRESARDESIRRDDSPRRSEDYRAD